MMMKIVIFVRFCQGGEKMARKVKYIISRQSAVVVTNDACIGSNLQSSEEQKLPDHRAPLLDVF